MQKKKKFIHCDNCNSYYLRFPLILRRTKKFMIYGIFVTYIVREYSSIVTVIYCNSAAERVRPSEGKVKKRTSFDWYQSLIWFTAELLELRYYIVYRTNSFLSLSVSAICYCRRERIELLLIKEVGDKTASGKRCEEEEISCDQHEKTINVTKISAGILYYYF